jgi:REDY-like protein HapK
MTTLIFTMNPKPGVSLEEFKHFLDTVDRPACLAQPSAISTRVLRVLDKDAPFALVEIFEIESLEGWERDTQSKTIQDVIRQWPDYGDVATLKTYQCVDFPVDMPAPGA